MTNVDRQALEEYLESAVDSHSMTIVLDTLSDICHGKANHVRINWQDEPLAKQWERIAKAIDKAAHISDL